MKNNMICTKCVINLLNDHNKRKSMQVNNKIKSNEKMAYGYT